MKLNNKILEHYNETVRVLVESKKIIPKIEKISKIIKEKIKNRKKIFVYGNGGSFADGPDRIRSASRTHLAATAGDAETGFRIVREID